MKRLASCMATLLVDLDSMPAKLKSLLEKCMQYMATEVGTLLGVEVEEEE